MGPRSTLGATAADRELEAARSYLRLAHPSPAAPAVEAAPPQPEGEFVLESVAEGTPGLRLMPIHPLPFRIGRRPGLELVLPSHRVSKLHAEIFELDGVLKIRDQKSRNGTFVNHRPVIETEIAEGDILHFGDFEFRIGRKTHKAQRDDSSETATFTPFSLSRQFLEGGRDLKELIETRAVTVEFQSIVRMPGASIAAYEALGRGLHPGLPKNPVELLRIAESIGAEVELSRLMRRKAVELASANGGIAALFLNTHPTELLSSGLVESMEELRSLAPQLDLTLEIHESALAQPAAIALLREQLSEINVGLAYDDFGAGQARLLELAEAPPHYLKFDRRFVAGIDQAPPSRRRLVASLVAAARELLVKTIAEGVETAAEAEVCARLGFTHAQGYHFGRPEALPEPTPRVVPEDVR
jgi:EAL domain-containing protein (putative c-di-GMP-specific phosphodiesterase class I)